MIYIGKFLHTTNQQEKEEAKRRHGEFSLLVSAQDKGAAMDHFRQRITESRQTTDFFTGDSTIYLVHILELEDVPQHRARMFNFQSIVGDPIMPTISCQAPAGDADGCRILDWQANHPGIDGQAAVPFMKFSKS